VRTWGGNIDSHRPSCAHENSQASAAPMCCGERRPVRSYWSTSSQGRGQAETRQRSGRDSFGKQKNTRSLLRPSPIPQASAFLRDCAGPPPRTRFVVFLATAQQYRPASLSRRCHCAESRGRMLPSPRCRCPEPRTPRVEQGLYQHEGKTLGAL